MCSVFRIFGEIVELNVLNDELDVLNDEHEVTTTSGMWRGILPNVEIATQSASA
jgi:hypothetical protein